MSSSFFPLMIALAMKAWINIFFITLAFWLFRLIAKEFSRSHIDEYENSVAVFWLTKTTIYFITVINVFGAGQLEHHPCKRTILFPMKLFPFKPSFAAVQTTLYLTDISAITPALKIMVTQWSDSILQQVVNKFLFTLSSWPMLDERLIWKYVVAIRYKLMT